MKVSQVLRMLHDDGWFLVGTNDLPAFFGPLTG